MPPTRRQALHPDGPIPAGPDRWRRTAPKLHTATLLVSSRRCCDTFPALQSPLFRFGKVAPSLVGAAAEVTIPPQAHTGRFSRATRISGCMGRAGGAVRQGALPPSVRPTQRSRGLNTRSRPGSSPPPTSRSPVSSCPARAPGRLPRHERDHLHSAGRLGRRPDPDKWAGVVLRARTPPVSARQGEGRSRGGSAHCAGGRS